MVTSSKFYSTCETVADKEVLCVGDLILDEFVYGAIERNSPEATVPVLDVFAQKTTVGGVGIVCESLSKFGLKPTLVGVLGKDHAADKVRRLVKPYLNRQHLVETDRQTTQKIRFLSNSKHILRVDWEIAHEYSNAIYEKLVSSIRSQAKRANIILVSDYRKGVVTKEVVLAIIASARSYNIPVIIDPKGVDFDAYTGATYIKPNLSELESAAGKPLPTNQCIEEACRLLLAKHGFKGVFVTRAEYGVSYISDTEAFHSTTFRNVPNHVSGAGDCVLAIIAFGLLGDLEKWEIVQLANMVGYISVKKRDTAVVEVSEILEFIQQSRETVDYEEL